MAYVSELQSKLEHFDQAIKQVEKSLTEAVNYKNLNELSIEETVKLDCYILYGINILYKMYLHLYGFNTEQHGIQVQLSRVYQMMFRVKGVSNLIGPSNM